MNIEFGRVSRLIFTLSLAVLLLAVSQQLAVATEPTIPRPIGYVNDFANLVEPDMERQIADICRELDEKTGTEITVATFPDIGDGNIDDFTSQVFEQWMPGQKGIDNGILILDAIAQRQIRIEIGYGLEPIIPDAVAGRIRREIMTPLLSQQRRGEAYFEGVATLAQIVAKEEGIELESLKGRPVPRTQARPGRRLPGPFIIFIILAILLSMFRRGEQGRGFRGGGPFIGGFGGGGFGGGIGGGGFGGFGGGGSGGGGSSGGY
jgi:uncharacterized protein